MFSKGTKRKDRCIWWHSIKGSGSVEDIIKIGYKLGENVYNSSLMRDSYLDYVFKKHINKRKRWKIQQRTGQSLHRQCTHTQRLKYDKYMLGITQRRYLGGNLATCMKTSKNVDLLKYRYILREWFRIGLMMLNWQVKVTPSPVTWMSPIYKLWSVIIVIVTWLTEKEVWSNLLSNISEKLGFVW